MAERRRDVVRKNQNRIHRTPALPVVVHADEPVSYRHAVQSTSPMRVIVVQEDTLDAAIARRCDTVLNFANSLQLGGGYLHGAGAQEEQICYRSTLPRHLEQVTYPWPTDGTMVFSRGVDVFRHNEASNFVRMGQSVALNVVSAAAQYRPAVRRLSNGRMAYDKREDALDMLQRMRRVLAFVVEQTPHNTKRRLVLGAWGCGAFGGPNYHVACLWREALGGFRHYFDTVVMAVLGDNFSDYCDVF